MTRQEISDATGFDNGEQFDSEDQVREYFTLPNMETMFGSYDLTGSQLIRMANTVIEHRWHCDF